MCLAQFATHYQTSTKFPKGITIQDGHSKNSMSEMKIYEREQTLPNYISLSDDLGKMRLRSFPAVLRMHDSKKKEGYEQFYAEMLLFYPWQDEQRDLSRNDLPKCRKLFKEREKEINENRKGLFPHSDTMDLLEQMDEPELQRPCHIFDMLDSQRQQEKDDDDQVGVEEDPQYAARDPSGYGFGKEENNIEELKYVKISVPEEEDILTQTRKLVPEQLEILERIVEQCKNIRKHKKNSYEKITGALGIIHGGAGVGKSATIRIITLWAEKILRQAGQNPNHPRVVVCAPTGKAASLISKYQV